jgi:ribosomal protein L11 methyltransferase
MTAWLQVNIKSSPAQIEALSDFIISLSGRGVQIDDSDAQAWELTGFLQPPHLPQELEEYVRGLPEPCAVHSCLLPEEDWHENWRRNFRPLQLTERMWVAPPWENPPLPTGQFAVIIDPGQAFGTGQHQSTRLCLLHLQALAQAGPMPPCLLDVGCGTGILSLAFLRLGGGQAWAIDIDPLALAAARHNAVLNDQDNLHVSSARLQNMRLRFPLLAANLTALDLCGLARPLSRALQPQGSLLTSGILDQQRAMVMEAMRAQGLSLEKEDSLGEWFSMVFRKDKHR